MLGTTTIFGSALLAQVAQRPDPAAAAAAVGFGLMCNLLIFVAIIIPVIVGMWKVFEKAGRPGWAAIIPIYNQWVLLEIVDKPGWLVLLCFIPIVGAVVSIYIWAVTAVEGAKKFGQGTGFAIGLLFLPMIFWPILGFGNYRFKGRGAGKGRRGRLPDDDYDDEDDLDDDRPRRKARRVPVDEDYDDEGEPEPPDEEPVRQRVSATPRKPQAVAPAAFHCPGCGVTLKLPPTLPSGKRVKCPKCGTGFEAP